jgi:NADPH:quinone reductase-like Zn-dependent oxidoreductase
LVRRARVGKVRRNGSNRASNMKLRHKIASVGLVLVAGAVVISYLALSYESACGTAPSLSHAPSMKAVVHRCYGSPDVLVLEDVAKPSPANDEVLVKIHAASVNPVDWHNLRGEPYVMRVGSGLGLPKSVRLGVDFAGTVEAVGRNVTRFRPGDEVFGGSGRGSLAEYLSVVEERTIALKPANVTFEEAAAVPVAATTALQALRDKGRIRPGQKVLINGASGGVGTFAVQIAKSLGAEVTGVCSTRNLAMVSSLGADHVVDYTREDFTQSGERYDVILDMVGNHSVSEYRRVLKPDGVYVVVGSTSRGRWLGPLTAMINAVAYSPFVSEELVTLFATLNKEDLLVLKELIEAGKVTPVIDRRYGPHEVPDALRYLEEGHARGKVVVTFR